MGACVADALMEGPCRPISPLHSPPSSPSQFIIMQEPAPLLLSTILDFPTPEAGNDAQPLAVPSAWIELFLSRYADAAVYDALFSACRGGRDFALRQAPLLTQSLIPPSHSPPGAAWAAQLAGTASRLLTRGQRQTALCIFWEDGPFTASACALLAERLSGPAAAGVEELQVLSATQGEIQDRQGVSEFLAQAAVAFPGLQSVSIEKCDCVLPVPQLPRLTDFCFQGPGGGQALWDSIALLVPQLTSLELRHWHPMPLPALFLPGTVAHTLTHFTTSELLDNTLITLILQHAPNLSHISAHWVHPDISDYSARQWAVRSLDVEYSTAVALETLARLPVSRGGRLVVGGRGWEDTLMHCSVAVKETVSGFHQPHITRPHMDQTQS